MNLKDYFKKPSALRVVLLAAFVFSALLLLLDVNRYLRSETNSQTHEALRTVLRVQSDAVGGRLFILESVALHLLERHEQNVTTDPESLTGLLADVLRSAPDFVIGAGLGRHGAGEAMGVTAYLSRRDSQAVGSAPLIFFPEDAPEDSVTRSEVTPRETNARKRLQWRMAVGNSGTEGPNLTAVLNARHLGADTEGHWESLIAADFSWIEPALAALEAAGAERTYCITPSGGAVSRVNGILYYTPSHDSGDETSPLYLVENARDVLADDDGGNGDILMANVVGTGWKLVADNSVDHFYWYKAPLWILLASSVLLLLEAAAASGYQPDKGEKKRRLPKAVHDILFKYRLTNEEQARIDSDLRVARGIQFSLVPTVFPKPSDWREFDLHAVLSPAREVGGDFYDFCRLDADRLAIIVGDVSGKGVPAALYMAVCQTAFRTLVREEMLPGDLVSRVNDILVRDNSSGRFVTIAAFFVHMPTGFCQYSLGGHPPPLWRHAASGVTDQIDSARETFIGLKGGVRFPTGEMTLNPGDTLLLYTDGATEARNAAGDDLETAGLSEMFDKTVERDSCREIVMETEAAVRAFTGTSEQEDDLTLLAFRYWGPGGKKFAPRRRTTTSIYNQPRDFHV